MNVTSARLRSRLLRAAALGVALAVLGPARAGGPARPKHTGRTATSPAAMPSPAANNIETITTGAGPGKPDLSRGMPSQKVRPAKDAPPCPPSKKRPPIPCRSA